ncbi:hypothetical protein EDC94DRAFT_652431 [Helicostylum pulchrum]|nr:hypothetical protein EDC94DRAFT_652431 [Helicostylum pulchrum]
MFDALLVVLEYNWGESAREYFDSLIEAFEKAKNDNADGGIMIKETSTPFLIIEAKKPDVGEKLALNLKTAWKEKNYEIPLFGVHVAGQFVGFYIFFKTKTDNRSFTMIQLSSFVMPDSNKEFNCLFCFKKKRTYYERSTRRFPAFLFGSILEAVWIHYWRFVFDEIPFIPNQVVCTAVKIYHQYTDQTNLDSPTLMP